MGLPINIELMDVERFVQEHNCKQVTSMFIKESTSNEFHSQGLFSEDIFGQIGSTDRLINFGFIDLRTKVFHPTIYGHLLRLKALYGQILSGKSYARFDKEEQDFISCSESDEGAGTGFQFFIDNFKKIKFKKNASVTQNDKVDLITKYRDRCMIEKCLVMPAGLRDMSIEDGKPASDSINKLYASLINYTKAMPSIGSESDLFDCVRFAIQKKINEIYDFIFDMIEGKFGFFQRKYGSRNLALGTRNVISPADMNAASPDDPTYLKMDEVKLPLFEAAKMYQPLVIYNLKQLFFSDVFSQFSDKVSVIDPKTNALVYQPITEDEKNKFITSEGIEKLISLFRDKEYRFNPVLVTSEEEKEFYLMLVYDDRDEITLVRSASNFIAKCKERNKIYNPNKLRPLTYCELLYMATYRATLNKCATVTRYPAIELGSDVPCKAHVISTNPGRTVRVYTEENEGGHVLPEYPVINKPFIDSAVLHPSILKGLGADFDGNCVVGSTTTKIKFTDKWLETIYNSDYSISKQAKSIVISTIKNKIYHKEGIWNFAEIRMDEYPQPGAFTLDKHGAKVYDIPDGCFVESFDPVSCALTYEPIKHITVEQSCDTALVNLRSKSIQVSTNESVAIFDRVTGGIKRVKPSECSHSTYVPVIVKSDQPFGSFGTFKDGWLLGSLLSDGWISDTYVGYAKNDSTTREFVKCILMEKTNCSHITKDVVDSEDLVTKYGKFGFSIRFKFSDKSVKDYVKSLNMYEHEPYSFFTKRIPQHAFDNGSEDYLWGILSGLIEGDGSYIVDRGVNFVDARITTSSPYLRDSIKHLCYRLGIRIAISDTPPRKRIKHTSYSITLSGVDICKNANKLAFASPKYSTTNQYVQDFLYEPKRDQRDIVPITFEEGKILRSVCNIPNKDTAFYNNVVMRQVLLDLIDRLDQNSPLVKRALNTNVHWEPVRSVVECDNETVYDFDIPSTKLYIVNDGVVTYDTVSVNGVLSEEANKEINEYLDSLNRYLHTNGSVMPKHDDLIALTIFNLSRDPVK